MSRFTFVVCILLCSAAHAQPAAMAPDAAAATFKLPPGFNATLFASEPAIVQPIAFTFDDRGRVWVVECLSYPTWNAEGQGSDRVTILEDTDGDGRQDKRTVFLENGVNLSGIEVGFGGVWLTSAPNFIFIPDANADDKPDGPPRVLLEGWTLDAKHNVVGNLAWGPDGWLYGCNGITAPSFVGKPGTPPERRQKVSCGVWRYHPVRHEWEVYANGTTNPWGLDWNERGEPFITNCVIKHLFHVVPGAHFVRMFGQDPNPYVFGLIESCADHQHWAGGHWSTSRQGAAHHDAGGGHAHSGCMIYLGDNWPAEYRGNVFTLNIHGQRLNRDVLTRHDSGYVASHAADFAFSQDPWFRGIHVKYGPDGGVYVSDWSDIGECHDAKEEDCDKTSGRIFRITWGDVTQPARDLKKLSTAELVALQSHANEWQARHARRILQERFRTGRESAAALRLVLDEFTDPTRLSLAPNSESINRLRLLFTAHATGQLDEAAYTRLIAQAADEDVRVAAIRLASERHAGSPSVQAALAAAAGDASPRIRLHIASSLQRVPLDQRWTITAALLSHGEDADDAYLPLMYWYAVEPLAARAVRRAIEFVPQVEIRQVRRFLTRRIVTVYEDAGGNQGSSAWILEELFRTLAGSSDAIREDMLLGLDDSFRGRRQLAAPTGWPSHFAALSQSQSDAVRERALELGVMFGDRVQLARLEDIVMRRAPADSATRRRALSLLVNKQEPQFSESLIGLLRDPDLRPDVIRALASLDRPVVPARLIALYPSLTPAERQDAIQTLTARPTFALDLLDAVASGVIPRNDVSALVIRQLQALRDPAVSERLTAVWGQVRPASADKRQRAADLKNRLTVDHNQSADLARGRAIFTQSCATCHKLFGEGGSLAPELTGSQRTNLDYVLDNVLDPSALVPREYKVHVLRLADGRVVQGVVQEENSQILTVQTANQTIHVPVADIEERKESPLSMMPEGLFDRLAIDEVRDLVAYLASPAQVPLPTAN